MAQVLVPSSTKRGLFCKREGAERSCTRRERRIRMEGRDPAVRGEVDGQLNARITQDGELKKARKV